MRTIQLSASQIVSQVLAKGRNLNQTLEETLNMKPAWQAAERGAIQDLSYGTLRFYGQLKAVLELLLHKRLEDERIGYLLLVALYQLQYSKAPQHTVVDQAVNAARTLQPQVGGLVNAILRNFLRQQASLLEQVASNREARFNHPLWWITELNAQYGELGTTILAAGNLHPPMTLRVNRRWGSTADYQFRLAEQGMSATVVESDALRLDKPVNVDKLPGFFSGWVSVQDAGAQYAALLLDVQSGMRVLDVCAAPGGKTAHILEIAEVEMVAVDKDAKRLQRVGENLQRLGLNARLLSGDAAKPSTWWDDKKFDRILADVPCSASGVVSRHPDIKWLRRREDIAPFAQQQLEILRAVWPLLKADGKLLYATCSVFKQENEQLVTRFLAEHNDARKLPIVLPGDGGGQLLPNEQHDGFFYALLHKAS
ncbi:MAG: 16S rRNA (cytosine(967)-C(5))-methyltransferase RsmB [Gallionella sp.]|nr:16S rRNA (cytosine(967)-C(5))-methyltransferase RsmB [Gallionella sp.]